MTIHQIIYASQPFGYDASLLSGILLDARRCNARDGITGALVCRRDIYLQLLEGPQAQVTSAYDRIKRDDRHANISRLSSGPAPIRLFAKWNMLHDPEHSWLWSEQDIADGILSRVTEHQARQVFEAFAARHALDTPDA